MEAKSLLFCLFVIINVFQYSVAERKVVCYYQSWAAWDTVKPEDLDPNLCTHVNYAFIGLAEDGKLKPNDPDLDINEKLFQRVSDMKKRNKNLKVLISVGGGDDEQTRLFVAMASDPNKRKNFVNSAVEFLKKYKMDGLDVDWEIPEANDKQNFVALLQETKNSFKSNGWLLSAAVRSNPEEGYDVPKINEILDYINLMTYDYYGTWSEYSGFNSPLYASPIESDWEKKNLNIHSSYNQWLKKGASANKLIIGMGFYGRSFNLKSAANHGIHVPFNGPGVDDGEPNYSVICSKYKDWTRVWDNDQKVPCKFQNTQWIGYDDEESIRLKVDYVKQNNAGGAMIWPIDGDDVFGACGSKQTLLKIIQGVRS